MDDKPTGPPPTSDEGGPKLCPARTRPDGQPCPHPAGQGTDHPGEGLCKWHGGAAKPKAKPPRFAPDPNTPVEPDHRCNGRTRAPDHHLCDNAAGFKTDHPGQGRCRFHAGNARVKTGATSKIHKRRPRIKDLAEHFEQLKDPFNILPELAMVRALAYDGIEHFEETRDALLAWYASWQASSGDDGGAVWRSLRKKMALFTAAMAAGDTAAMRQHLADLQTTIDRGPSPGGPPRPREVPDITDLYRVLSEVTKIVDRDRRLSADTAVSRADLVRIMSEMGNSVALYVMAPDLSPEERLQRIRDAWANLHL